MQRADVSKGEPAGAAVKEGGGEFSRSPAAGGGGIDLLRLRSLVGLTLAFVAPRANLAVSGVLLTLLVTHRSSGALAITLALTANRLVGWLAYPLLGRASDRSRVRAGRRVPFLAVGLLVMGLCTWAYTMVGGYWPLVGLIVIVKTASVVFGINNVAAIPETFGKSRTLKAVLAIAVLGTAVSLLIKFTVIATWKTAVPATWNLPFRLAAGIMIGASILVVVLVREAPVVRQLVDVDRQARSRPWRDELSMVMKVPNAAVLLTGLFLFWSGISATGYLAIVYFEKVQGAGAGIQTIAGWITGVPAILIGFPVGLLISRSFTRKQVAIFTPLVASGLLVVQFFTTHFWQSVVLAIVGAPLFTAFGISTLAMLVQLLPRSGGIGELIGKLIAPFSASAVIFSFLSAWAVDASGNYRVIWLFPAVAYAMLGVVMLRLRVPRGHDRLPPVGALLEQITEGMLSHVTSRDRPLLAGEITATDADATSWFDTLRNTLGNPYEDSPPDESGVAGTSGAS